MHTYLLGQGQEQRLILHPLQVQVGVRVQDLQALEELIIQPLNESNQVAPDLHGKDTPLSGLSEWMPCNGLTVCIPFRGLLACQCASSQAGSLL